MSKSRADEPAAPSLVGDDPASRDPAGEPASKTAGIGTNEPPVATVRMPDLPLWDTLERKGGLVSFDAEITARCNLDCRHCYINRPSGDREAARRELSAAEILGIADQAARLGALWCLLTGGEPLLRPDFPEIYIGLKKRGFLVSLFTNATMVEPEHARLLATYPPRSLEATVYGATAAVFDGITRRAGSHRAFLRGLDLLQGAGLKVGLKAVIMRSNIREFAEIARFCRERSAGRWRFDPVLHLRYDRDERRNADIRGERLEPGEIVALEKADPDRFESMTKRCDALIQPGFAGRTCAHLFHCRAGLNNFTLGPDGTFRLCSALNHPDCVLDLRVAPLEEAVRRFVPRVRGLESRRPEFYDGCRVCPIVNLCLNCPAHADLETGALDGVSDYFCRVARARREALEKVPGRPNFTCS